MIKYKYKVKWEIELDAESPEEAAKLALEIQRDPESIFFNVSCVFLPAWMTLIYWSTPF